MFYNINNKIYNLASILGTFFLRYCSVAAIKVGPVCPVYNSLLTICLQ